MSSAKSWEKDAWATPKRCPDMDNQVHFKAVGSPSVNSSNGKRFRHNYSFITFCFSNVSYSDTLGLLWMLQLHRWRYMFWASEIVAHSCISLKQHIFYPVCPDNQVPTILSFPSHLVSTTKRSNVHRVLSLETPVSISKGKGKNSILKGTFLIRSGFGYFFWLIDCL